MKKISIILALLVSAGLLAIYPRQVLANTEDTVWDQMNLLTLRKNPNSTSTITLVSSDGGDDWGKQQMWIRKCQDAVREKLKDPDSAKFKDVYFVRGRDKIPTTCGQVNSKNSFGAYGGFERFVSMGSADKTFLKSELKDFHNLWNRFCTK